MPMLLSLDLALELARRHCAERFPHAAAVLAGSVARGTATPASDIDLVLVFERLGHAWRETVSINGVAVEIFAHDPETLAWFFDRDRDAGSGALATMLVEGVAVTPPSPLLSRAKAMAEAALALGPPPLDTEALDRRRYIITDLAEDLRGGGTPGEVIAVAALLYPALADLVLRAGGQWSGTGKALARCLEQHDPALALRFEHAFGALFRHGHAAQVLGLVEEKLAPLGGPLAAGYHRAAPATWRKK
jgi:predicted nucleotidyltransferase